MSYPIPEYRLASLAGLRAAQANEPSDRQVYRERFRDAVCDVRTARAREGQEAPLAVTGRVQARRQAGKLTFLDLGDYSGRLQVMATVDRLGAAGYELLSLVDLGDIVGARGTLGRSRTGELTLFATEVRILAKALQQPPEKHHGLRDPELRARHRTIDLHSSPEVAALFEARVIALRAIRRALDDKGFLEVETPMLHPVAGGASARPFTTHHNTLGIDLYLRIAPELYLKRLLVGGFTRVYEINRNFRNEGISPVHNPEFTMLEVYQVNGDVETMMDLAEDLVRAAAAALVEHAAGREGSRDYLHPTWRGQTLDLASRFARRSYSEAFADVLGFPPTAVDRVRERAAADGIEGAMVREAWDVASDLFETHVEPSLIGPVFIHGYPTAISPLAMRSAANPELTDRFELFAAGKELANAFSELNDPLDQRGRFEDQARRKAGTEEAAASQVDEDFLYALEQGMPPAGGMGIGIDRLMMMLLGADTIRDVIFFPLVRPKDGA